MKKKQKYLECAAVVNTHGVKGTVRLESRCDSPEILASLKRVFLLKNGEYVEYKVKKASVQKRIVLAALEGIDTLEDAIALRGTVLYADRDDFNLGEGEYFIADLLGMTVYDDDTGEELGTLSDVISPGAHQVYVVSCGGGSFMVPNVPEFVRRVSFDEDAGIYVHLIEGMRDIQ